MNDSSLSEIYSVGIATIRRWRADGRRAGLPAPLTTPDRMPEWWNAMVAAGEFEKTCPMGILEAAGRMKTARGDDDSNPVDLSGMGCEEMDYALSIEVAKTNLLAVKTLMDSAVKNGNEDKIVALQRPLKDAQTTLRELSRDRGKIQAEAGETLPKSEVRTAMLEIHGNIVKRFRQGIKAAFPSIEEHGKSQEEWNQFAEKMVDSICAGLNESDFAAS